MTPGTQPEEGDQIEVSGTRAFTGHVIGSGENLLIVLVAPGHIVHLRQNIAGTDPSQWRCAGQPVTVKVTRAGTRALEKQRDFQDRLQDLERKTRYDD
jgi:hypothetical protein